MSERRIAPRLSRLPTAAVLDFEVRAAVGLRARLLGLAYLDRDEVGDGLLIPRCSSVHTFGMRFPLDLYFLDGTGSILVAVRNVPSRRLIGRRGCAAILELPHPVG